MRSVLLCLLLIVSALLAGCGESEGEGACGAHYDMLTTVYEDEYKKLTSGKYVKATFDARIAKLQKYGEELKAKYPDVSDWDAPSSGSRKEDYDKYLSAKQIFEDELKKRR